MTKSPQLDGDISDVRRIQLYVTGMSCGACAAHVATDLNKLDRVRASVDFATRIATVEAGADVDAADLCEAVRAAGYDATECFGGVPEAHAAGGHSASGVLGRLTNAVMSPIHRMMSR